jgi:hypothetical protein
MLSTDIKFPRIVSLLDMVKFSAFEFGAMMMLLSTGRHTIAEIGRLKGMESQLPDSARQKMIHSVTRAYNECVKINLDGGAKRAQQILRRLQKDKLTYETIVMDCASLEEFIHDALEERHFAYIEPSKAKFFEQDELFGNGVALSFPSTAADIKDAGNCLASGLDTAAVFHLMRIAERGLRILARDRRVKIKKTKLDYAEWQTVIDGITKKIEEMAKARRGPKKSEALEFYRGALGEFYAFKDAWRNHVMHSRERYDENQALSAFQHVSEFMKRLSTRLSEAKISPLAWRL